jgi:hypothetical protein
MHEESDFRSASVAIAPRKKPFQERHQSGDEDGFAYALPDDHRLGKLLGFDAAPAVGNILMDVLLRPVADLTANPGKRIRAQLVSSATGFSMAICRCLWRQRRVAGLAPKRSN